MLSCQEVVELVTDYLEGALSEERRRELVEHLRDCIDCLRYYGQIQLISRLLGRRADGGTAG